MVPEEVRRPPPIERTVDLVLRLFSGPAIGLNAVRCYDLDLERLSRIAVDIGPTPEQLNQDLDLRTPPNAIREARFWFDDYGIEWKD
jgi:hypothetical protein